MNTVSLKVSGITNAQMKATIKNALNKINGVKTVDIDQTLDKIEVGYVQPASEQAIRNCVEGTGYKLN